MASKTRIKVIITKIGLDTHVVGAKLLSQILRNAGMEVIYLGEFQTPEMIVNAAIQEHADVVGISDLAASYRLIIKTKQLLREKVGDGVLLIAGGTVAPNHVAELTEAGVSKVFNPDTHSQDIIDYIVENVRRKAH